MASIGTLYTTPEQGSGKRVRIPNLLSVYARLTAKSQIRAVAALNGLKIDLPEHYVHFEDNKKPEFLAKFPHGKIPAFDGADGFKLFESAAIARYGESTSQNVNGRRKKTRISQSVIPVLILVSTAYLLSDLLPLPRSFGVFTDFVCQSLRSLPTPPFSDPMTRRLLSLTSGSRSRTARSPCTPPSSSSL